MGRAGGLAGGCFNSVGGCFCDHMPHSASAPWLLLVVQDWAESDRLGYPMQSPSSPSGPTSPSGWAASAQGGASVCLTPAELMFLETSALTGENVEEAFLKCARTILNKIESGASRVPLAVGAS